MPLIQSRAITTGLLRSQTWLRGPAKIEGDELVFDAKQATEYVPAAEPQVGVELAKVREGNQAIAFVARFGLLRAMPANARTRIVRESLPEFLSAAARLATAIRTIHDVRHAWTDRE